MSYFKEPEFTFIGNNALEEAIPEISSLGKKALIVTGKHVGKSPMHDMLVNKLKEAGVDSVTFDGITGEPTDTMIAEGYEAYTKNYCDFLVGIGGGSPLDSAKAIATMTLNDGKLSQYMGKEIKGEIPPVVAIPTTAGTGSEATKFFCVTDTENNVKMLLKGDVLIPKIAVINSDFTMDMPKSVTVATGLDAFTHAAEAYTSKKAMPLTDTLALDAVKRIVKNLPIVYKNGYDGAARTEMAIAAYEAGVCINNSSVTIVHGMSRPIGALFHVPHGLSNAMLLKGCLGFALDGTYERFADLSRNAEYAEKTDSDEAAAKKFLDMIDFLVETCEVPTLKEYGVPEDEFFASIEKMAGDAIASGSPANTRKEITKEDCMEIYKKIYAG